MKHRRHDHSNNLNYTINSDGTIECFAVKTTSTWNLYSLANIFDEFANCCYESQTKTRISELEMIMAGQNLEQLAQFLRLI